MTKEPLSAGRCAAASMMTVGASTDPDAFHRLSAWKALSLFEPNGLERWALAALEFTGDPEALKAQDAACRATDPQTLVPDINAPAGDGMACLKPSSDALSLLSDAKSDPAAMCEALQQADQILKTGIEDLEQGRLACNTPRSGWTHLGAAAFNVRVMKMRLAQSVDCDALRRRGAT